MIFWFLGTRCAPAVIVLWQVMWKSKRTECCVAGRHIALVGGAWLHGVVWRSHVAGEDTLLVSKSATLLAFTATLFLLYDSLIEKCSTLPVV
jgi:hypothetical protein